MTENADTYYIGEIGYYYPAEVWMNAKGEMFVIHDYEDGVINKFTDAARNFWREYAGVLDNVWIYPDGSTISCDDGRRFLAAIYFYFYCITEDLLTQWCVPQPDDFYPDYVGIIREKYG